MNLTEDEITEIDPVFAPWDGRRVPVTLLGGYLGAGKTTVINEMLARTDRPIAVLVNDVGDVNVDAALIRRQSGDTIELTGGCVCCSMKNGLLEAFGSLRQRDTPPDHVVVELSGIADPLRLVGLVGTPGFVLDGVVVLVDLDQFLDQIASESVTSDAIRAQLDAADLVLLTKGDLVDENRRPAVIEQLDALVPGVPILTAESAHAAAGLVGLATRRPLDEYDRRPSLFDQHRTSVVALPDTIRRTDLENLVDSLEDDVVRAKAIVQVETGEFVVVQVVGKRRTITRLPEAERQPTTDLVVVRV